MNYSKLFSRRLTKGIAVISVSALMMSNMATAFGDRALLPSPVPGQQGLSAPTEDAHAGITVNYAHDSLSQAELDAFKQQAAASLNAAREQYVQSLMIKPLNAEGNPYKPDDIVNVIVQLDGQTVSQITAANSGAHPTQQAVTNATNQVLNDIRAAKDLIQSGLSGQGASISQLSVEASPVTFKQEYENVFKGFSVDHIKYRDIDYIKSLSGVKSVTIQRTFMPAETTLNKQHEFTHIEDVWNGTAVGKPTGYKGEGMVVAIVDTGVDYNHEAFPDPKSITKAKFKKGKYKRKDGTTSLKVVAGYNWADQNDDIIPRVELPTSDTSSHGVHVAGISAGSGPVMEGVAPEAQIIAEKVFSDHLPGALEEDIVKGIDHAASLGADSINMSLGSSSSFDKRDPQDPIGIAIRNATDAGHVVVVAAGNASNAYDGQSKNLKSTIRLGETPDLNKIGTPGVYPDSFTVAAANNIISKRTIGFQFLDKNERSKVVLGEGLDSFGAVNTAFQIASLGEDKLGEPADYEDRDDLAGKIVLIQRGILTFDEKVKNAKDAGAIGVIVYNNSDENQAPSPQGMMHGIPFSFITNANGKVLEAAIKVFNEYDNGIGVGVGNASVQTQAAGLTIKKYGAIPITIVSDVEGSAFSASNPGQPTDFTSWGTTSDLNLKPDIMAPGHVIVSSIRSSDPAIANGADNAYEQESGTSMAAPYVAGAVVDVMQALIDTKGFVPGTREYAQTVKNLLMNTSIPAVRDYITDADAPDYMTQYQPRRQGSGMIRPDLAVKTPVVVSGEDGTASVSLKEIDEDTTFTLTAKNLTNQPVEYKLSGTVMEDILDKASDSSSDNIRSKYMKDSAITFTSGGQAVTTITVPANGKKSVAITLTIDDSFTRNTFAEGYIKLEPTNAGLPTLSVPYNGFYGKWDEPSIIDTPITQDDSGVWAHNEPTGIGMSTPVGAFFYPQPATDEEKALGEKFYSFNFDPYIGIAPVPIVALLRNARHLNVDVVDKDHTPVTHLTDDEWQPKADPYASGSSAVMTREMIWDGTNEGVPVPDGQYYFAVTATADYPGARPQPTVYLPVFKDTTAPAVTITKHQGYEDFNSPEVASNGGYVLKFTVADESITPNEYGNVALAQNGIELTPSEMPPVTKNADGTYQIDLSGKDTYGDPWLKNGKNVFNLHVFDRAGNISNDETVVIENNQDAVTVDLHSASYNHGIKSLYWDANVKPGGTVNLSADAYGKELANVQAVIMGKDSEGNFTVLEGEPVDVAFTETDLVNHEENRYSVEADIAIPDNLTPTMYRVGYVFLKNGQVWNSPGVPFLGIDTYVSNAAPTLILNTSQAAKQTGTTTSRAYAVTPGESPVSFMLNTTITDQYLLSRGYKVSVQVDNDDPIVMGSIIHTETGPEHLRYPVQLTEGDHTLVFTVVDAVGDSSTISYNVNVNDATVDVKNGDTDQLIDSIPILAAGTISTDEAVVDFSGIDREIHTEMDDPMLSGYLTAPNGIGSDPHRFNPDFEPILLMGQEQESAVLGYIDEDFSYTEEGQVVTWPAGTYYFNRQLTGFRDAGGYGQGHSLIPVTVIDYMGNKSESTIDLYKNNVEVKVDMNGAMKDPANIVSYYTNDPTFTITGTVTDPTSDIYSLMVDWTKAREFTDETEDLAFMKNLFGDQWLSSLGEDIQAQGLVQKLADTEDKDNDGKPDGVHPFSFTVEGLKPGHNLLEIDGGKVMDNGMSFTGNHPLVLNIDVFRFAGSDASDAGLVDNVANTLTWNRIKGDNPVGEQNTAFTNLALPTYDSATQTTISWSSTPNIITNEGLVTRQPVDTDVELTATVTRGSESKTVPFTVTVPSLNTVDPVDEDLSYLTWNTIRGGNMDPADLTEALKLPAHGANGTSITWSSDTPNYLTDAGLVYKPVFGEPDAAVKLTATVTAGDVSKTLTFDLTVKADMDNQIETQIRRAIQALDVKKLLGKNVSEIDVTQDLVLPATFDNGGTITWESDNGYGVGDPSPYLSAEGKVTRPSAEVGNQGAALYAKFTLNHYYMWQRYDFFIRSADTNDGESVQAAQAAIVWNLIRKDNADQQAVTTDLNLPKTGNYGTTITWTSNKSAVNATNGAVVRPSKSQPDIEVTLTATTRKNDAAPLQKTIKVVVLHDPDKADAPSVGGSGGGGPIGDPGTGDGIQTTPGTGKVIDAPSKATETVEDGKTVTSVKVDDSALQEALKNSATGVVVNLKSDKASDRAEAVLTAQSVQELAAKEAKIVFTAPGATYTLDTTQVDMHAVALLLGNGLDLNDIQISIQIVKPTAEEKQTIDKAAADHNSTIVGAPVSFNIVASHEGKDVIVDKFNGYVQRSIEIPDGTDHVSTGVVIDEDGTMRQVPTNFEVKDGKTIATISSLTNSMYALVNLNAQASFSDVKSGWAKSAIENLATRMIVQGQSAGKFNPSGAITRAEFATILVNALGVKSSAITTQFGDVAANAWYAKSVSAAYEYGLITGVTATSFAPTKNVTRQEAMTMLARAMKWAGYDTTMNESGIASALAAFKDQSSVSEWAKAAVAANVKFGIVNGDDTHAVHPQNNISRAEVAAIVEKVLKNAHLIN